MSLPGRIICLFLVALSVLSTSSVFAEYPGLESAIKQDVNTLGKSLSGKTVLVSIPDPSELNRQWRLTAAIETEIVAQLLESRIEAVDEDDDERFKWLTKMKTKPINRWQENPVYDVLVTGVTAGALKTNSEAYSTIETLGNYRERIDDLSKDRFEATRNNDDSWIKRIDKEIEQIEGEIGFNEGKDGQIRERFDFEKAKRKIAENIRRGRLLINEHHKILGAHLLNCVKTRGGFRYEPDQEIDWLT